MSSISAWKLVTLVDHPGLTVSASVANGTGACVVLASVETCGTIVTGSVVGAEVEILVAHLTAPSFLTFTGPGFGACAMDTARIYLTLVASGTLPSLVTNALARFVAISVGVTAARSTDRFQTVIIAC